MNRSAKIISLHLRNPFLLLALPWVIVFSSFLINLVISGFLDEPLYTGGLASIFIIIFVTGITLVPQTFPLALGLGATRREYYTGTVLTGLMMGVFSAVVITLLGWLEQVSGSWGTGLHFFHLPYVHDGSLLEQLILSILLFMFFFFCGLTIAAIYRGFGRASLLITLLGALLIGTLLSFFITQYGWWMDIFGWFARYTAFELSLWTLPLSLVMALMCYVLIRRSVV
ncbi:hypothetical protein [Paenibacillus daejeonensis]|uniref:hypothetical protein n=1 Tax=Paenibacillus daejeonensis TaxID=135193 RepID=UPI00036E8F7A|nr:hypothetical protein [Paenibacillus daejeonensis]